jgi:hypothetical protein
VFGDEIQTVYSDRYTPLEKQPPIPPKPAAGGSTTLVVMAYTTAEGRKQLLDGLAEAADEIGLALAALGEAYEQVDEHAGERLEAELFRPVQAAYGRAKRVHAEFAKRSGLPSRPFEQRSPGAASSGAKGFVESAVEAAGRADHVLAELQDSMLPVEVGDVELRAGISRVRELLVGIRGSARELVRTLGR